MAILQASEQEIAAAAQIGINGITLKDVEYATTMIYDVVFPRVNDEL